VLLLSVVDRPYSACGNCLSNSVVHSHGFLLHVSLRASCGFQWLFEGVHVVGGYSKHLLNFHHSGHKRGSLVIKFLAHAVGLYGLAEETGVLRLLATIGLVNHIFKNVGLFEQVAFDISALSGCHLCDSFLLCVQNVYLLLAEGSLLGELQDVLFDLVKCSLEAERLV